MRGIFGAFLWGCAFFSLALPAHAQQNLNQCLELSKQLEQMIDAQNSILNSMVKKNDAVAETLDQFAEDLGGIGQRVKKADLVLLRQSAKSFRGHSVRESELVGKFSQKTGVLAAKIGDCLQRAGLGPQVSQPTKVGQGSRDSANQTQR